MPSFCTTDCEIQWWFPRPSSGPGLKTVAPAATALRGRSCCSPPPDFLILYLSLSDPQQLCIPASDSGRTDQHNHRRSDKQMLESFEIYNKKYKVVTERSSERAAVIRTRAGKRGARLLRPSFYYISLSDPQQLCIPASDSGRTDQHNHRRSDKQMLESFEIYK
jgi:hypothetical protein